MKFNAILLSTLSLVLVSQAEASKLTFNTLPPTFENGTYNGFVETLVDGALFNLVCNDFASTTHVPSGPLDYNLSILPSLTFARFGNDQTAVKKYKEAALLIAGDGGTLAGLMNVSSPDDISSYQYALWSLFTPSVSSFNNSAALLSAAQNDLINPKASFNAAFDGLRVYTPMESAASNQEFLQMIGGGSRVSSAPEPASLVLMGIGLLALTALSRRFTSVKK